MFGRAFEKQGKERARSGGGKVNTLRTQHLPERKHILANRGDTLDYEGKFELFWGKGGEKVPHPGINLASVNSVSTGGVSFRLPFEREKDNLWKRNVTISLLSRFVCLHGRDPGVSSFKRESRGIYIYIYEASFFSWII